MSKEMLYSTRRDVAHLVEGESGGPNPPVNAMSAGSSTAAVPGTGSVHERADSLPSWAAVPLVALLYYAAARLGLLLAFEKTNASPVWPPSGLALAAVLLLGGRVWPGVFAGAFAANMAVFAGNHAVHSLTLGVVSAGIAAGNTLEAMAGAWLFRRWIGTGNALNHAGAVLRFVAVAILMCLVSAGLGSASLLAGGVIPHGIWSTVGLTWWIGDVAGVLILAPALLMLRGGSIRLQSTWRIAESLGLLLLLLLAVAIPFGGWLPRGLDQALMFLLFPVFLWPAFRLGQREAAGAVVCVSLLAVWQTAHGVGPFTRNSLNESLLLLQGFVCVIAITIHALAAALAERKRVETELHQVNQNLTRRSEELLTLTREQDRTVAERTRDLVQSRLAALNMMRDSENSRQQAEQAGINLANANELLQIEIAQRQRAVEEAQAASRAKSDFLATMSHEIRTPMNGVLGFTNLLLGTPLNQEQQEFVHTIKNSGESLLTIINDILDFSKIEAGRITLEQIAFDVRQLTREAVEILRPRALDKKLHLEWDFAPDAPSELLTDPTRVRQVLLNLVGNAVKFTAKGGVTIRVEGMECLASGSSNLGGVGSKQPRFIRFSVTDTGMGIPKDKQPLLFQKFSQADSSTTRKFGGTGLGLAISKRLIELMGGQIGVESEPGRGSTFWFTLPRPEPVSSTVVPMSLADQAGSATEGAGHETSSPITACRRVLVAEDNDVNQRLVNRMLKNLGCCVDIVSNGREAVALNRQIPFDMIFMDCQMPEMDGFEAAACIRQEEKTSFAGLSASRRVPIIALTANAMTGDREQCLAAGMDDYLAKPLRAEDLKRVVEQWSPNAQRDASPVTSAVGSS